MKLLLLIIFSLSFSANAVKLPEAKEIPIDTQVISYGPELNQDQISDLFIEYSEQFRGRNLEFNLRCKWQFGVMYGFAGVVSQQGTPTKDENAVISITINTSILCRN